MIKDEDIIFITTTIFSECLELQQSQIKKYFPNSKSIIVDGSDKSLWPNSMFKWIDSVKNSNEKYFVLIDEDCFLVNKEEILNTLNLLENNTHDIIGCPDGYHPFRTCNPIVINPFLLFGRVSDVKEKIKIDFYNLKYKIKSLPGLYQKGHHYEWSNSAGIKYKHIYKETFIYPHPILSTFYFQDGKEPYYCFFWYLKEQGFNFGYLFPFMDEKLISTNPKINESSKEMAIHIWESRNMTTSQKLFGKTAKERFELAKNYISNLNI